MKIDYAVTSSRFFCTECGKESLPIMRKKGQRREAGHLKKLYCVNCKKENNHFEVRDIDENGVEEFKKEYELGRFVNGNRTPIKDLMECSCEECKFNINGKCWNSNYSYNCGHRIMKEVNENE